MDISLEKNHFAKLISDHVNKFSEDEAGDSHLLVTIHDYMELFMKVMNGSTPEQMNYLSQKHPGFYRYGKILESMAEGISDGTIEVPKDH